MNRKPIFAAVAEHVPGIWNIPGTITLMDHLLDVAEAESAKGESADPFTAALAEILRHEGGFVDHPRDPGGMTNLGVTKRTWEGWTGKPATEVEMRALTPEKVAPLYRKNYWEAVKADELPASLALCVFDFAVNAGPARAVRYLQRLVGTVQDGVMGPVTVSVANSFAERHGKDEAVKRYQQSRRDYYRQLPHFKTFGRGWLRRVDEVERAALEMVDA